MRSAPAELLGPQPPAGRSGDPPPAPPHDPPPAESDPHPQGHPLVSLAGCSEWSWGAALTSAVCRLAPRLGALLSRVPAFKPSSRQELREWEAAAGMLPHKESANMLGMGELEDTGSG